MGEIQTTYFCGENGDCWTLNNTIDDTLDEFDNITECNAAREVLFLRQRLEDENDSISEEKALQIFHNLQRTHNIEQYPCGENLEEYIREHFEQEDD